MWLGMTHITQIDPVKKSASVGLVLSPDFIGSGISFSLSYLTFEWAFKAEQLQVLFAKIQINNEAAMKYNQILGFKRDNFFETNSNFYRFSLTNEEYQLNQKKWLPYMA
jgi:RimJ/RimL family protein N-acetyltransferase